MPRFLADCVVMQHCPNEQTGKDIFQSLDFLWDNDFEMCRDCNILEVIIYLRGGMSLNIPSDWRGLLPSSFS